MQQEKINWRDKYTDEEIEVAFIKWKKKYRPSPTHEPDATYIFHVALMEGDISQKHLFRVKDRLRDVYRRDYLKGRRIRVIDDNGKQVRRWVYDTTDMVSDEDYHHNYATNKKVGKPIKTY